MKKPWITISVFSLICGITGIIGFVWGVIFRGFASEPMAFYLYVLVMVFAVLRITDSI